MKNKLAHLYNNIINNNGLSKEDFIEIGLDPQIIDFAFKDILFDTKDNKYIINNPDEVLDILLLTCNYQLALNYLDILCQKNNDIDKTQDYNYYYCILAYLTPLNEQQKEFVSSLTYDNVKIINKQKYPLSGLYNGVRRKVFKQRFNEAKDGLHDLVTYHKPNAEKKDIIQDLMISKVISSEKDKYDMMYELILDSKYEDLYNYLNGISNSRPLSRYEQVIFDLLNDLINGNIVENNSVIGFNFMDTIKKSNYREALKMSKNCEEKVNHPDDVNIICILLEDIITYCDLNIKRLSRTK